ncbi:MAG: VCBS repeat-containing protein, partial [Bacteroidetes bacterium]
MHRLRDFCNTSYPEEPLYLQYSITLKVQRFFTTLRSVQNDTFGLFGQPRIQGRSRTYNRTIHVLAVFLFLILVVVSQAFSQPFTREIETIPVIVYNDTIAQPFAGGVDAPNHRFVDIDGDNDFDLFIFDADQNVDFYRNEGTPQQAELKLRPNELTLPRFTAWFLFVDLNGDATIDFLSDNGGNSISYYPNTGTQQNPVFTLQDSTMLDTSGSPIINGYIGIPTFADLDGDNDYDFYASNFDGSITLYENIGTHVSPSFRYADGRFQGVVIVNDSCLKDGASAIPGKNALHGGSILQLADINGDSAQDLIMGDLNSQRLFLLPNNGNSNTPLLQCSNESFPPDGSLHTSGYNQPNLVDIDGDDDLDLFIGGFINMGPNNMQRRSFWFYENIGVASTPIYQL